MFFFKYKTCLSWKIYLFYIFNKFSSSTIEIVQYNLRQIFFFLENGIRIHFIIDPCTELYASA